MTEQPEETLRESETRRSCEKFVATLIESRLMSRAELDEFLSALPEDEKPSSDETLAKALYRHKRLTKFQTQAVFHGKIRGIVVGNYVVLDKIGRGGMGDVYKAQHKRMKREVALKVLPSNVSRQKGAVERFHREVVAAARLTHPNIVTAHDADEAEGAHFLVMELVDGVDLSKLVRDRGTLDVAKAVDYMIQAATGLQYAHEQGVIHRDIKPSNLLVDRSGTIKILDMGLARFEQELNEPSDGESLTESGLVMGTLDYMAPEQAVDTHRASAKADIYSLGCTLYFLLTGQAVFEGRTMATKILSHRDQPAPSLRDQRDDVPEQLDRTFQRMLAKQPEDRQASMAEVIRELEVCRDAEANRAIALSATTDSSQSDSGNSLEDNWLQEELPDAPTAFRPVTPVAEGSGSKQRDRQHRIVYGSIFIAATLLLLALGLVARLGVSNGTLVVQVSEPGAAVEILDSEGEVQAASTLSGKDVTIPIAPGSYELRVSKAGFKPRRFKDLDIASGMKETYQVWLDPTALEESRQSDWAARLSRGTPPPAIAPFDGTQAKKHQQAWADYLGVPVEREIDLPAGERLAIVLIPPGEFVMGSSDDAIAEFVAMAEASGQDEKARNARTEGPPHRVTVSCPYYLGKTEVTQAQWKAVMETNPSEFTDSPLNPVERVSWDAIQPFLKKLNDQIGKDGLKFVLPTEAQWEHACRAGTTATWHFGDRKNLAGEFAWFYNNADSKSHPVGELKPNPWGLHDIHGNVWEWCADYFKADYYAVSPSIDPQELRAGSLRVLRGGSWCSGPDTCRGASRFPCASNSGKNNDGFRLAAVLVDVAGAKVHAPLGPIPPLDSPDWTWSEPVNLGPAVNTAAYDFGPTVSVDERTLYYASNRPGGCGGKDLWKCTRSRVDEPFGEPVNLGAAVNSQSVEASPALSADGLTLVFASMRPGGQGNVDLWKSQRARPDQPFGTAVNMGPPLSGSNSEDAPALSADGLTLVFGAQDGRPNVQPDLKMSVRSGIDQPFGDPIDLGPSINTNENEMSPALSADGLNLIFMRGWRLFFSTRSSLSEPFGEARRFPAPLDHASLHDPELSADGMTLYFASKVLGGHGEADLWFSRRVPKTK